MNAPLVVPVGPLVVPSVEPSALGYHAMRLRWCWLSLLAWLRRWGVVVLLVAALAGAGVAGGLTVISALAAWLVLPLFYAVSQSAPWAVCAVAVQALVGVALVLGLRPWLLPAAWLEAERALPISRRTLLGSDLRVVLWALSPLLGLYGAGAWVLTARRPAWLMPHLAWAWLALALAVVGSVVGGVALLEARRRPHRGSLNTAAAQRLAAGRGPAVLHWPWVLLALPLWRGPARRCGAWLGAALLGHGLLLVGLWCWPAWGGVWLGGLAVWALFSTSRAATLVTEDTQPLLVACTALPLPPQRMQRAARALPLLPLLPLLVLLGAAAWWGSGADAWRPVVLGVFTAALAAACSLMALAPVPDTATRAARSLLLAALLLALASAVFP